MYGNRQYLNSKDTFPTINYYSTISYCIIYVITWSYNKLSLFIVVIIIIIIVAGRQ